MSNKINHFNRLSKEKSPYLLQHSRNPVDWYPWGNEAFAKAMLEDKPVFLSIGYSTCHWCHVMENESFEDDEVARLLNEFFICIKVDREERPDIDNIYMSVCTMMTGSGGWPLTIIMAPDRRPFFAATYIPKQSKLGRTGLLDLIPKINEIWITARNEVEHSAEEITALLNRKIIDTTGTPDKSIFIKAYTDFASSYDAVNGGFGNTPKFPCGHNLLFLLRYWKRFNEAHALAMVEQTLKKTRLGGIFDHVGFGFHRYSTDAQWLVPHFEKMLYDQAMLAMAYAETYQATKDEFYAVTCSEILTYVLRDMTSPEGGFYSAEDADSQGIEGKFYLWLLSDFEKTLTGDELETAVKVFNIKQEGNSRQESGQVNTGENILHSNDLINEIAEADNQSINEFKTRIENIREKLFLTREKRIHPYKDDKILTDWNGLMIAAFALAGRILNNAEYINAAVKAVEFIKKNLWLNENRLLHRYREGEASIAANLDDYAFLSWGLIELYQATFNADYLVSAISLTEVIITHFADEKSGVFYFSPDDGEEHITKITIWHDGAIPSGNSVAFYNLVRLGRLTGNPKWEGHANKIADHVSSGVNQMPSGHAMFLAGLDMAMSESLDVVIAGNSDDIAIKQMISAINRHYLPNVAVIHNPAEKTNALIADIAPFIKSQTAVNGKATAYVCRGNTCRLPVNDVQEMTRLLESK